MTEPGWVKDRGRERVSGNARLLFAGACFAVVIVSGLMLLLDSVEMLNRGDPRPATARGLAAALVMLGGASWFGAVHAGQHRAVGGTVIVASVVGTIGAVAWCWSLEQAVSTGGWLDMDLELMAVYMVVIACAYGCAYAVLFGCRCATSVDPAVRRTGHRLTLAPFAAYGAFLFATGAYTLFAADHLAAEAYASYNDAPGPGVVLLVAAAMAAMATRRRR